MSDPTTGRAQRRQAAASGDADDAVDRQSPRSEGGVRTRQTGVQTGDQPTREQVAADLDIDPSGIGAIDRQDGRDLFLRSEGVEEVRQTTTERFVEQADFIQQDDVVVDIDRQDIRASAGVAEDRRDAVAVRAREQTAADAAVVEPEDLDVDVGARGVEDLRIRADRRDAVGERARERTAVDSDLIQADDLTAEVGATGVEDVFIAEERRDAVGERARERAADGRFVEPGDFRAEVGETGVESVELREGADDRIESRQRDALREDVAADAGVDPSEVEIDRTDDGFEALVPGEQPDESEIRDELRSDAAAEFDEFGESDILIDQDGDEFTARVDPDAQREQAAESIEAELREDIRDDAPDFLQDFAAIGDDPTRIGPRGLREAMDQFQSGEIGGEQLREVSRARRTDAAIPTVESVLGEGLDADDLEAADDGFALGQDVQQRAATVGIDAEVDADRITDDDVVLRDGEAQLTDDAQRRVARIDAADEFEDFGSDDLQVTETGDGELQIGVSPAAQRDRILDEVGPSAFVVDGGGGDAFSAALSLRGQLEGIASRDDVRVALEESGSDVRTTDPIADIIEGLDPDTAGRFDVLDADEVRAAQQDIETTRQQAQRDPEAFVNSLDEIDLTDALEFDESAARGRRQRSELRDQAEDIEEDIAAEQAGVDADDVDLRLDGEGGLTLRDDSAEIIERAAAADDLGVERDQVVETDEGFGVDPDVVEAELRSDFASEAGVDTDDVVVDREADGFEARLADDVLGERQAEAIAADQAGVDAEQVDVAVDDGQIEDVGFTEEGRIDATAAATDGVSADDLTLRDGDVALEDRSAAVPGDVARFGSPEVDPRTLEDIFRDEDGDEDEEEEEEFPLDDGDNVEGFDAEAFRSDAAEELGVREEDVDIEIDDGEAIATRADGFELDASGGLVDAVPFAGSQFGSESVSAGDMIGADEISSALSREADEIGDVVDRATILPRLDQTPGAAAVDAAQDFEAGDIPGAGAQLGVDDIPDRPQAGDRVGRDVTTPSTGEALLGAGAAGVAVPEPGTSAAGVGLAAVGAGALAVDAARRSEIDLPEPGDMVGVGGSSSAEIDAPESDEPTVRREIDAPTDAEVSRTEIETPEQPLDRTGEIGVPDQPVDRTGEIGVPTAEAQQLIGGTGQQRERDARDQLDEQTFVIDESVIADEQQVGELDDTERFRQIREELERRQEFVRDVPETSVDREPVRFPGEGAAEASVDAGRESAAEIDTAPAQTVETAPAGSDFDVPAGAERVDRESDVRRDIGGEAGSVPRDAVGDIAAADPTAGVPRVSPDPTTADPTADTIAEPDIAVDPAVGAPSATGARPDTGVSSEPGFELDTGVGGDIGTEPVSGTPSATGVDPVTGTPTATGLSTGTPTAQRTRARTDAQTQQAQASAQAQAEVEQVSDVFAEPDAMAFQSVTAQPTQMGQGTGQQSRTRDPPRPPIPEADVDDEPDPWAFDTDDDVFGSGILGGDEAFEQAFQR